MSTVVYLLHTPHRIGVQAKSIKNYVTNAQMRKYKLYKRLH